MRNYTESLLFCKDYHIVSTFLELSLSIWVEVVNFKVDSIIVMILCYVGIIYKIKHLLTA